MCLCWWLLSLKTNTPGWLRTTEKKSGGVQDRVISSFSCLNAPQSKSLFVLYKLSLGDMESGLKTSVKHSIHCIRINRLVSDLQIILRVMTCVHSEQDNITQMETSCGVENSSCAHVPQFFLGRIYPPATGVYFSASFTVVVTRGDIHQ